MPKVKNLIAELPQPQVVDVAGLCRDILSGDVDLLTVLGPTASGKTKYAVRLARELDALLPEGSRCEIISADSRQVYRGMDVGTGKDLADYCSVPYHIIDVAEPGTQYNVHDFQQDFIKAYASIKGVPVLCGGTGLYISAVTGGYDFKTKSPLSEAGPKNASKPEGLPRKPYFIGTLVDRATRNERIDARLDQRLEKEGMVEEIRGLLDKGVPAERLISYGLEYKYVTLYVLGELSYDGMRVLLSTAIHQFAKRQMTWWRGMERSGVRIHWVRV